MNVCRTSMIYLLFVFLLGIGTTGCSRPHVYIHPTPGLDSIKRISVMPFDNFTDDEQAGKKVRANFVIELLRTGSFDVMDTGEVDSILEKEGLSYGEIQRATISTAGPIQSVVPNTSPPQNISPKISAPETEEEAGEHIPLSKKIGDALNVEAILVGSVEAYGMIRTADQMIPEVSISVRLIDAETGIIIWANAYNRRGSSGIPILGLGKVTSLSALSQKVIQDIVKSLAQYAR
ncbi:MAG: hypothetical protein ACE5PV_03230 [Candidatus Poribacteria bacterium]